MIGNKSRSLRRWPILLVLMALSMGTPLYPIPSTQACGGWGYGGGGYGLSAMYGSHPSPWYGSRYRGSQGQTVHRNVGPRSGGRHG
ncbi:MAG: hypothetical protein HONDAALG_01534 [Gammaproteobacteria bacterium]|nr:hypothetical protein [Gammaproteobacteria bacterium]